MPSSLRFACATVLFIIGMPLVCAKDTAPAQLPCEQPLHSKVENSCVVSDQMLWRGARPSPEAAAALVELGAKTVVSLELIQDDRNAFEAAVISKGVSREIEYFQIRDWEPLVVLAPGKVDDHVAQFLAITRTQPKPIYVHCRAGQNRTGIMVAAYKIFAGANIEETVMEMEEYGGLWSKSDAEYLRTLTPERRSAIEERIAYWIPRLEASGRIVCANGKCVFNTVDR